MNRIINSWNIESGNLYSLGNTLFNEATVQSFRKDEKNALRDLCQKVLESDIGSRIASKSYWSNDKKLIVAVAFSEEHGLQLKVNGKEHAIATADAVYKGEFEGLAEIKRIQAAVERAGLIPL